MAERIGRLRKSGYLETLRQERRKQELLRPNRDQPAPALHNRRRSAMEQEWSFSSWECSRLSFSSNSRRALRYRQQLIDEIGKLIRPPQPQEPGIMVVEEGTDRLGYRDFNPALMTRAHRWR
jgi:hypothetical protein